MTKDVLHKYIGCHVPVTACNLRCHYCYIGQLNAETARHELPQFKYPPERVARALSRERLGGTCLFNVCGAGETLLPPEMPAYIKAILSEGHFLELVTNMILSPRIGEILSAPQEHLERLIFKCSFHYLELKRLGMLERFADNVQKIRQAGCSFTVEFTPSDELIPHLENVNAFALHHFGALPHFTVARDETKKDVASLPILTKLPKDEYENTWKSLSSSLFDFKYSVWGKKVRDFCYAGEWSCYFNLCTGETKQCYSNDMLPNILENPSVPIAESPVCTRCREPHCYNAHAFFTLGLVPSIGAPTYADLRDRVCQDSSHWFTPRARNFYSQKLYNNNPEYSQEEKDRLSKIPLLKLLGSKIRSLIPRRILDKIPQNLKDVVKKWLS